MPLCSQLQLPGVAGLGVFDAGYHVDRHSEVDQGAPRGDNYKSLTFTPTQTTICPRHVRYPLFNTNEGPSSYFLGCLSNFMAQIFFQFHLDVDGLAARRILFLKLWKENIDVKSCS